MREASASSGVMESSTTASRCSPEVLVVSQIIRGLSYEQAEFELVQAPLTEAQKGGFDAAARFWGERLRPALERAAELTKVEKRIMTAFWGSHQRFFMQADATPFPLHTHPRREVPRPPRR